MLPYPVAEKIVLKAYESPDLTHHQRLGKHLSANDLYQIQQVCARAFKSIRRNKIRIGESVPMYKIKVKQTGGMFTLRLESPLVIEGVTDGKHVQDNLGKPEVEGQG